MYHYSDSESRDSDEGIRYKTDSTRNKQGKDEKSYRYRSRSRSPPRYRQSRKHKRERSSSSDNSPQRKNYRSRTSTRSSRREETKREMRRKSRDKEKSAVLGPALSSHLSEKKSLEKEKPAAIGPALSSDLLKKKSLEKTEIPSVIGPAPPYSSNEEKIDKVPSSSLDEQEETPVLGPSLPPHLLSKKVPEEDKPDIIGPTLPPHLTSTTSEVQDEKSDDFSPQLPSHLKKESPIKNSACIGPQLPAHMRQKLAEESTSHHEEDDDDDVYGPLPADSTTYSKTHIALEERALKLKIDQLEPQQNTAPVREEWMLELPEVKAANLGLGPRQFRSKAGPDMSKRSSWTDTPNKKEKPEEVDLKKEAEMKEVRRRDKEQEKIAKKLKKKNKESLLEMHQSELKKKKKDEGPSERRPFSREIDLKVNRFDEAQKKAVLKKAQLLDDRFSSGQSKFL